MRDARRQLLIQLIVFRGHDVVGAEAFVLQHWQKAFDYKKSHVNNAPKIIKRISVEQ